MLTNMEINITVKKCPERKKQPSSKSLFEENVYQPTSMNPNEK